MGSAKFEDGQVHLKNSAVVKTTTSTLTWLFVTNNVIVLQFCAKRAVDTHAFEKYLTKLKKMATFVYYIIKTCIIHINDKK